MSTSIRFNPNHFASVPYLAPGAPPQEAQTVWHQIEPDCWLQVEIRRNPTSYSTAPFVKEAKLMRGQRSAGGWNSAHVYAHAHSLHLLEDATAAAQPEPTPQIVENAGTRHIAATYADSKPEARPDVNKARAKRGMW